MSEVITITREGDVIPGEYDEQGNPKRSAASTFEHSIRAFAPSGSQSSGSTESGSESGIQVISGGAIYDVRGAEYRPSDILTIRGEAWQVQGEIADWAPLNPPGPEGIVVGVKRLT